MLWMNPILPVLFLMHLPLLPHALSGLPSCIFGHCFHARPVIAPMFAR